MTFCSNFRRGPLTEKHSGHWEDTHWTMDEVRITKGLILLRLLSKENDFKGNLQQERQYLLFLVLTVCHIGWMCSSLPRF